jgi:hypothetical protein
MATHKGLAQLAVITGNTYTALIGHLILRFPDDSSPQQAFGLSGDGVVHLQRLPCPGSS